MCVRDSKICFLFQDEYPEVYRFVCAVYPSADDDVITSPYNSVLATYKLTEMADCVLPINNQSLINICNKVQLVIVQLEFLLSELCLSGYRVATKRKGV